MQKCADKAGGVTGRRGTPGVCWGTEQRHDSTAAGTGDGLCIAISGGARNPSEVMNVWLWVRVFLLQGKATEVLPELGLVS